MKIFDFLYLTCSGNVDEFADRVFKAAVEISKKYRDYPSTPGGYFSLVKAMRDSGMKVTMDEVSQEISYSSAVVALIKIKDTPLAMLLRHMPDKTEMLMEKLADFRVEGGSDVPEEAKKAISEIFKKVVSGDYPDNTTLGEYLENMGFDPFRKFKVHSESDEIPVSVAEAMRLYNAFSSYLTAFGSLEKIFTGFRVIADGTIEHWYDEDSNEDFSLSYVVSEERPVLRTKQEIKALDEQMKEQMEEYNK